MIKLVLWTQIFLKGTLYLPLTGKVLPVGGIKEKTIAVSFFALGYV
jgi:ATP-dependent Lon protease